MSRSKRRRRRVLAGSPAMIEEDVQLARAAEAFMAGVLERERALRPAGDGGAWPSDPAAHGSPERADLRGAPEPGAPDPGVPDSGVPKRRDAARRDATHPEGSRRDATPGAPSVILDPAAWQETVEREAARWQRHGGSVAVLAVRLARRRAAPGAIDAGVADPRAESGVDPSAAGDPFAGDLFAAERYAVPLGEVLRHRARASDPVARIASDQFSVLLLEADEAGAAAYAERIRAICEPWVSAVPGNLALRIGWSVPGPAGSIPRAAEDALARVGASSSL